MRMRRHLLIVLVMAFQLVGSAQWKRAARVGPLVADAGGQCDTSAWRLVFSDEFQGDSLDTEKWRTWFPYSDDGSDRCAGCRTMGTSNTIFRDELVRVQDGMLRLGVRARTGEWYGQKKGYEGAMVHTKYDRFTHGRFEVRCRIPRGAGLWPAFWGFGGETEIDVFEFCGEQPGLFKAALHRWAATKYSANGRKRMRDLSRGFHTYAVEWEADGITWSIDGRAVHHRGRYVDRRGRSLPACERPAGDHHAAPYFPRTEDGVSLILDLAVSAPKGFCKGPRGPVDRPEGTSLDVDHVRVYQRRSMSTER
jgi:hypothetical protein